MRQNKLVAAGIWLRRIGHCRGFGIQSPWAYRFVRYVVNEHSPYYAFGRLKSEYGANWLTRKLGELLFRMANFWQPEWVVFPTLPSPSDGDWKVLRGYLQAGCRRCRATALSDADYAGRGMVILSPTDAEQYEQVAAGADKQTLLVVMAIGHDPSAKALWKRVLADSRARVTFDLYHCGVVFFDTSRYKENHIINF